MKMCGYCQPLVFNTNNNDNNNMYCDLIKSKLFSKLFFIARFQHTKMVNRARLLLIYRHSAIVIVINNNIALS